MAITLLTLLESGTQSLLIHLTLTHFDKGDYQKAIEEENLAKNIVEVLYPNDNHYAGKELRLKQQYFFVSASVQRAVDRYKSMNNGDVKNIYKKVTIPA